MPAPRNRRHIFVPGAPRSEPFTSHPRNIKARPFARPEDRPAHAARLIAELDGVNREALAERIRLGVEVEAGIYVEFVAPAGVDLHLDSLDLKRSGIRLLAVHERHLEGGQSATVFVPDGKVGEFIGRFERYASETTKKGEPKNKELVDRIALIRLATLRALWTDDPAGFPEDHTETWWEVWLRHAGGGEFDRFLEFCNAAAIRVGARQLAFHDRVVCLIRCTAVQLSASLLSLRDMAELRRAKTGASFFVDLPVTEQVSWLDDLVDRTTPPDGAAPSVCLLDTGVTRSHPLIQPALAEEDATAIDLAWGSHDDGGGAGCAGHGTQMAGLALYGDLAPVLESSQHLSLRHCLESVKILPPTGANEPELYGALTAIAVSRPEIQAPDRNRVFSMAVTAPGNTEFGQPTSWSAAVDALAAGRSFDQKNGSLVYLDAAEPGAHRLFVLSAGNVDVGKFSVNHLDRSDLELVHDPAQSWNAIAVGAYTEKCVIVDPALSGLTPVAKPGDLSPWSTTSCAFQSTWPNKPDVVLEGGNVAEDGTGLFDDHVPDLCLLSTYFKPFEKPFVHTNATSAASAQAARMAAMIAVEYPTLWPETRRALLIHSARWTPRMMTAIDSARTRKTAVGALVRRYGFGVPDIDRALRSANDALTLVVESTIHPYAKGATREMHLHQLPWPVSVLKELHAAEVRLRVVLSYFIEPNPARLGWKRRHRYASHGLRFDVKTASESVSDFRKRLNKKALDTGEEKPTNGSDSADWLLGDQNRHRGSLHSDIWEGTAEELSERNVIGIYPVSGWWKDQPKWDRSAAGVRYALVVSIECDAEDIDIWTPVAQEVGLPIVIET